MLVVAVLSQREIKLRTTAANAPDLVLNILEGESQDVHQPIPINVKVVLIGDPGVGKTAIAEGLAQMIVDEKVPKKLLGKRLLSLELGLLVADTKYRGEFEQRLRDVINKNLDEAQILDACRLAFEAGWNLIKLYFMIGLPTETDADVDGLVDLTHDILSVGRRAARGRRVEITLSASSFIPKAETPFQWLGMDRRENLYRKQERIARRVRRARLRACARGLAFRRIAGCCNAPAPGCVALFASGILDPLARLRVAR